MAAQKKKPSGGKGPRLKKPPPPTPSGSQGPGSTRPGSSRPKPQKPAVMEVLQPAKPKPAKPGRPGRPRPGHPKPIDLTPGKPVAPKGLDQVVAEVNGLYIRGALETALAVASVVVEHLLGGDDSRLVKGEKDPALRSLAEHEDLRVPPHTLWAALGVYSQVRVLPEEVVGQLTLSHHRALLGVPNPRAKVNLARRTISDDLSSRELQEAVTKWRLRNKLPAQGRPAADPATVASRRMSTAALRLEQAVEEKLPTSNQKLYIVRKIALTERRLQRVKRVLGISE